MSKMPRLVVTPLYVHAHFWYHQFVAPVPRGIRKLSADDCAAYGFLRAVSKTTTAVRK